MLKVNYFKYSIPVKITTFSRVNFVVILTLSLIFLNLVLNQVYNLIEEKDIIWGRTYPLNQKYFQIIISVLVAPFFETWTAQSLPYKLLNKLTFFKKRNYLILLISAVFFGLNHYYSLYYMIYGFILGIVIMYAYMSRIKTDKKTFYLIVITHGLFNLIVFLKSLMFQSG
jgi:uncharacterized protein